jgi:hypothetical protein
VAPRPEGDGYGIALPENGISTSMWRLVIDGVLFEEYVEAAASSWVLPLGTTERREEVLSLMVTYVEAALASVDPNGRNHVTELGLRRAPHGRVDWYRVEDRLNTEPAHPSPDPDLRWVADRPRPAGDDGQA